MPVLVTGVGSPVGRHAVEQLVQRGGEVRTFVQADDGAGTAEDTAAALRAMRCKVAVGSLTDEGHLETALEQVHTVLHLLGRPTDDPDAHLEQTATVVSAAIGAGCRRLVVLSDLAVTAADGNRWLQVLAEVEELAEAATMESVVLRAATIHAIDDVLTTSLAAGALGADPVGSHRPVAAADVATAAVLADAERDLDLDLHVLVDIAGPTQITTADYVETLARLVPAAAGEPLPPHAVELMGRVIEPPADALGAAGRPLEAGLD